MLRNLSLGSSFPEDAVAAQNASELVSWQATILASMALQGPPIPPPPACRPAPPFVVVVGCGQVGASIIRKLLRQGWTPDTLGIIGRNPNKFEEFAPLGVQCSTDAQDFLKYTNGPRTLILAVPQAQLRALCASVASSKSLGRNCLVVSVVAGVTETKLRQLLPSCPHIARTHIDLAAAGTGSNAFDEASKMLMTRAHRKIFHTLRPYFRAGTSESHARALALNTAFGVQVQDMHTERGDLDPTMRADTASSAGSFAVSLGENDSLFEMFGDTSDARQMWEAALREEQEKHFAKLKAMRIAQAPLLADFHEAISSVIYLVDIPSLADQGREAK